MSVMRAQHYIVLMFILLLSEGCSTASDNATVKATQTSGNTAAATSAPMLKTPPPTVDPSYSLQVESIESPNHEWIAQTSFEQEIYKDYHIQFTVSRKDGTKTWAIMDEWGDGIGYIYPQLHQWSNDSQYFYFNGDHISGGGCDFFPVDSKWQRLDVDTGQVSNFRLPLGRGHAISPDELTIAYASPDTPLYISLYDIKTGQEEKILLSIENDTKAAQAGDILWTSDGNAVILSIATSDGCSASTPGFYMMRVDIHSRDMIQFVSNDKDLVRPLRLEPPNHLLVRDWNGYTWWIDTISGTPTGAP